MKLTINIFILICFLFVISCSFDKDEASFAPRDVSYNVDTSMENVELILNYYTGEDLTTKENLVDVKVIKSFPWKEKSIISPLDVVKISGYFQYSEKNSDNIKDINRIVNINLGNCYLNVNDTIKDKYSEKGFSNEDLIKNTTFNFEIEPIPDEIPEDSQI
ncbi:MAG: hypothetical protein IMY73_04105 [Bacteroidetes bacterium]|nr:hypothetical protein [Bacteroidota bacterium]